MIRNTEIVTAGDLGRRAENGDWLLRDISFDVRPGDQIVVSGPSGSGKSLLLRALSLLDPLDCGEVRWNGHGVGDHQIQEYRSQVMYLHQRPSLLEGSVADVLRHPFSLHVHRHRQYDQDRVVDLLAALGRDASFLTKWSRDLSGGESQVVSLVRALQLDPRVLLLDEPTAAMDTVTTTAAEQLITQWVAERSDQRAVLWVSHDQRQAANMAGRTLVIDGGQLVEDS